MIPSTPARQSAESSAHNSKAVTPSDSAEVADYYPKGVYVGGAGNIVGQLVGDTTDTTFTAVPAGTFLPVSFRLIKATGTTATSMVVVW